MNHYGQCMPNDTPKYLAIVKIRKLDQTQETVETTVKATSLERLQQKVTTIINTMEEGDL